MRPAACIGVAAALVLPAAAATGAVDVGGALCLGREGVYLHPGRERCLDGDLLVPPDLLTICLSPTNWMHYAVGPLDEKGQPRCFDQTVLRPDFDLRTLAPPASEPATAAPPASAPAPDDSALVRLIQQELGLSGYDAGDPDGSLGPRTAAAIRAFQHDQGLVEDGRASAALLAAIRAARPADVPPNEPDPGGPPVVPSPAPPPAAVGNGLPPMPAAVQGARLTLPEVYGQALGSVYQVFAEGAAIGSAVAVSSALLLTSCRVLGASSSFVVGEGSAGAPARITISNLHTDTCVLAAEGLELTPVPGVRPFAEIAQGETVIAIGRQVGSYGTYAMADVAAKGRLPSGLDALWTSVRVSASSFGGGLFDEMGNLVGIMIPPDDADGPARGLAIAVEEFWRR